MLNGKRITVVMPAYNAEKTLRKTHSEIPHDIVDNIILTDDASQDRTAEVARQLNIKTFVHMKNKGYGGNQKTCYQEALRVGPILSSCCTQITNTRLNSLQLWPL